jgi:hypothetical protein
MSAKEVSASSARKPLRIASSVGGVTTLPIFGRSSLTVEAVFQSAIEEAGRRNGTGENRAAHEQAPIEVNMFRRYLG